MPTIHWLKKEFDYGYDSGNILGRIPNRIRRAEQRKIGGSYRRVFFRSIKPYLAADATVLELGPGNGAWSRAILDHLPQGKLITLDYQDVTPWLQPGRYSGRLVCHQVTDNSFREVEPQSIDFFWSMGVLCHNNQSHIAEILRNARSRMKPGGVACHQYADWDKLNDFGWRRGGVPQEFQSRDDDQIWWPRNRQRDMAALCRNAGWEVVSADLGLLKRDSMVLLRCR